jgi:hypothetical protein
MAKSDVPHLFRLTWQYLQRRIVDTVHDDNKA